MLVQLDKGFHVLECPHCGCSELVYIGDCSDYEYLCTFCEEYFDEPDIRFEKTGEDVYEMEEY